MIFNIKEMVESTTMWRKFEFEVLYSSSGVARIYINHRKTKYNVGGYGYDKESAVIAQMINDLTTDITYNKKIYGNNGKALCQGGCGFSSIAESFNNKRGNKLVKIYSGFKTDVYSLIINTKYIKKSID